MMSTSIAPRPAAVLATLKQADRWVRGYRKSDGLSFWAIPSSTGEHIYYTTNSHCTCPDANQRQRVCKHSLAVQKREHELSMALGLATDSEADVVAAEVYSTARARAEASERVYQRLYGGED